MITCNGWVSKTDENKPKNVVCTQTVVLLFPNAIPFTIIKKTHTPLIIYERRYANILKYHGYDFSFFSFFFLSFLGFRLSTYLSLFCGGFTFFLGFFSSSPLNYKIFLFNFKYIYNLFFIYLLFSIMFKMISFYFLYSNSKSCWSSYSSSRLFEKFSNNHCRRRTNYIWHNSDSNLNQWNYLIKKQTKKNNDFKPVVKLYWLVLIVNLVMDQLHFEYHNTLCLPTLICKVEQNNTLNDHI